MELIAFERGIRCNPPPFESRRRRWCPRTDLFSIGLTRFAHGWRWRLSKAACGIRARGEKQPLLSSLGQRGPIFFRQYWPSLHSGRRRGEGKGSKNSCGFHVARMRRWTMWTEYVVNPGCSTRRLDYTADLSEASSALSPLGLPRNRDLYSARVSGGGRDKKKEILSRAYCDRIAPLSVSFS